MSDDTAEIGSDSRVFKVSIRAWLSLILIGTVCIMGLLDAYVKAMLIMKGDQIAEIKVQEPLYSAALLALGFYFGQKKESVK